jgi:hypothetical protein
VRQPGAMIPAAGRDCCRVISVPETADFLADMTMSGYGMTGTGAVDPTQPLVDPHTHHIQLTNAKIIWDMKGCPAYMLPATTTGFQIKGTVSLMTGNGTIAPFETDPPSSTLQVCVTGSSTSRAMCGSREEAPAGTLTLGTAS